jgi:hypothetical protein
VLLFVTFSGEDDGFPVRRQIPPDVKAFCVINAGALAIVLAGCGVAAGSLEPAPERAQTGLTQAPREELLYASTIDGHGFIFSYPRGGVLETFAIAQGSGVWGMCADAKGDVFVTSERSATSSYVYEYAHGGTKPIATLRDQGYAVSDCASDPVTGDLAVTNYDDASSKGANVAIYRHARGAPQRYFDAKMSPAFCGYDDRGNLFVDGSGEYQLAELARGNAKLENIALNEELAGPGGVQWDGKDLAIENDGLTRRFAAIERVAVSNSKGTVVGVTHLHGLANRGRTFWIEGGGTTLPAGRSSRSFAGGASAATRFTA